MKRELLSFKCLIARFSVFENAAFANLYGLFNIIIGKKQIIQRHVEESADFSSKKATDQERFQPRPQ